METTTVSTRGRIVLPAKFRRRDKVEPGQVFKVERIARGEYRLVHRVPKPNEGFVDWLLACPEKGWLVPMNSEAADSASPSARGAAADRRIGPVAGRRLRRR